MWLRKLDTGCKYAANFLIKTNNKLAQIVFKKNQK